MWLYIPGTGTLPMATVCKRVLHVSWLVVHLLASSPWLVALSMRYHMIHDMIYHMMYDIMQKYDMRVVDLQEFC